MPTDPTAGDRREAGSAESRPRARSRPSKATAAPSAAGSGPATSGGSAAEGGSGGGPGGSAEGLVGPELARAALDAALAKRGAAGQRRRPTGGSAGGNGQGRRLRGYSGPGPDPRDPQLFGAVLERLVKARGWQKPAAEAKVFGAWEKVVGPDVASHCRPIKLADGELTVEAESTAWATQLRLLAASLLKRIAGEVGHNVVKKLHIHGPAAPSWSKGLRRVQGRGPRDTYG
ncbi:MAG TPA: DciA family protein [Asanoa sp.]|nr:DciA family protein [Asanoa sp.]